jgi:hypothetical protein
MLRRIAHHFLLAAIAIVAIVASGCGGYTQRMEAVRSAVIVGDVESALHNVDAMIAEAEAGKKPYENDLPLLLLERGSLYQARQDHAAAVADFGHADAMLEVLDLTPDRVGAAAEYLWSGSASLYRPPIYEKLMVNVAALASYLALGDTNGARVEARRLGVLLEYFDNTELAGHGMLGAANAMAGLAMELGGDDQSALRFYLAAWEIGDAPGLAESVVRLSEGTTLANNPGVTRAREALGLAPDETIAPREGQEVVAIVFHGLAPSRVPEYLPIGAVVAAFRVDASYNLDPAQEAALARGVAEDLLTWINFPRLVVWENSINALSVHVDGSNVATEMLADVESFALAQWEHDRPGIAFAAVIRAIVRLIAREAVQAVGRAAGGAGQTIGFLAGLATQGAMQAADQPDTRTWTMMPAYISIARLQVSPGEHTVLIEGSGKGASDVATLPVSVAEGGTAVVTVRFLR